MADIFISYAREDRGTASALADALAQRGWTVFWDRQIPTGEAFDRVIEREMDAARCVIVLWSRHSVGSDWVRSEAREGLRRRILRPAVIDAGLPPLEFRGLQTANLAGWRHGRPHAEFDRLAEDLAVTVSGTGQPGEPGAGARVDVAPETDRPTVLTRKVRFGFAGAALAALVGITTYVSVGRDGQAPLEAPPSSPETAAVAAGVVPGVDTSVAAADASPPMTPSSAPEVKREEPATTPPAKPPARSRKEPSGSGQPPVAPGNAGAAAPPDPSSATPVDPVKSNEPDAPAVAPPEPPPQTSTPVVMATRESVERALREYEAAFSSGEREAVRRVFPAVSDTELREVAALKVNMRSYRMVIAPTDIAIADGPRGKEAVVQCQVFHNWIDDSGKAQQNRRQETLRFEWTGATWVRVR